MKRHLSYHFLLFVSLSLLLLQCVGKRSDPYVVSPFESKVDSVMALMTLEEKIGQMSMTRATGATAGPILSDENEVQDMEQGLLGNLFHVIGTERIRMAQEIAVNNTRLKIPLSFIMDVIHGYRTIFPIPLGEAASWDLEAIEKSARIAAMEAAASGINWTHAPMVNLCRDPRWGGISEGAGEDKYLASMIARARVRGLQGDDLGSIWTLAATAKHYAGYGASFGGPDRLNADFSRHRMHAYYLVPFRAAVEEGVRSFMLAPNEWNGIPVTASEYLVRNVLRDLWDFDGVTLSYRNAIPGLADHGFAWDHKDAAYRALRAGCDLEMDSKTYRNHLKKLVDAGQISESMIDEAVRRILRLKFELGLFKDPYRYCDRKREDSIILHPEHIKHARQMAQKSMVLLKNDAQLLPISKNLRRIAVIGPLAKDKEVPLGIYRAAGSPNDVVSLLEGIQDRVSDRTRVVYSKGCNIEGEDGSDISQAVRAVRYADVIIAAVGEGPWMSGEAASRRFLDLPGRQQDLLEALEETGKPLIVILMNGRPLDLRWMEKHADAILETWFGGIESGNAIADILFGDYNPSGRLPVSFPYSVGQIPVHYDRKSPDSLNDSANRHRSHYKDSPDEALYPFGYGLSYSETEYFGLELDRFTMQMTDSVNIKLRIANKSDRDAEETVQLYIHDEFSSMTRPDKELIAFRKTMVPARDTVEVHFIIKAQDLSYLHEDMIYRADPGSFEVLAGPNSRDLLKGQFILF